MKENKKSSPLFKLSARIISDLPEYIPSGGRLPPLPPTPIRFCTLFEATA